MGYTACQGGNGFRFLHMLEFGFQDFLFGDILEYSKCPTDFAQVVPYVRNTDNYIDKIPVFFSHFQIVVVQFPFFLKAFHDVFCVFFSFPVKQPHLFAGNFVFFVPGDLTQPRRAEKKRAMQISGYDAVNGAVNDVFQKSHGVF